jgi:uncharacterized Zn-binding protein involved in type VI secretion
MKMRLCSWIAAGGLVLVSACARQESAREIDWAKAALARNPAYEIVATDDSAGVFTVRSTSTGQVETLKLQDLIASPLPPKVVAQPAPAPAAEPVESPGIEDDTAGTVASSQTTEPVEAGAAPEGAIAQGPGYSIQRADSAPPAVATLEGPGYSITREGITREGAAAQGEQAAQAPASNVERRTDPIVCQGDRLMRIDGETIEFSGDAVIAEKGCDLYISNARITAGGVGIIVRQARVHIVNSTIGGTRGSYEASQGAEIYVARSTFTGIGRRFDSATMNDLGGNAYETN